MNQSIKTQGLLLQSIPYLGQKKILKILCAEEGLVSLFASKSAFTPFCLAEWVYRKSTKEIHPLQDATLLDPLSELKTSYPLLSAAGSIVQDLLRTQLPGKRAPLSLAYAYLKRLSANPSILAASFKLKLLLHEGLLSDEPDPIFTLAEWEQVRTIAFARQFSLIEAEKKAPLGKIEQLFTLRIR